MHGSFIIIKNTLISLTIFKQIIKLVSSLSSLGLIGNSWKLNFGSWQSLHRSIRKKIRCSYSQNDVFPALTNYSVVILTFLEQFDADWTKPIAVNDIFHNGACIVCLTHLAHLKKSLHNSHYLWIFSQRGQKYKGTEFIEFYFAREH